MALILCSSYEPRRSGTEYQPQTRLSGVDMIGPRKKMQGLRPRKKMQGLRFARQESGLFDRFEERHTEMASPNQEVQSALLESGLLVEATYECFTFDAVNAETRRVMWVARKPGAAL